MKLILSVIILCSFNLADAQQADYYLKSFNPHIEKKDILKIDPTITVVENQKSTSLKEIDQILEQTNLYEILKNYDNVDRYIFGQRGLNLKLDQFINHYADVDAKKLSTFALTIQATRK